MLARPGLPVYFMSITTNSTALDSTAAAIWTQPLQTIGLQPAKPQDYQTKIKSRVSVPLMGAGSVGSSLEMTIGLRREDNVEFTLIQPGRQAISFVVHRKDVEALVGELTLDRLSK